MHHSETVFAAAAALRSQYLQSLGLFFGYCRFESRHLGVGISWYVGVRLGISAWYGPGGSCMQKMSLVQDLRATEVVLEFDAVMVTEHIYLERNLAAKCLQSVLLRKALLMHASLLDTTTTTTTATATSKMKHKKNAKEGARKRTCATMTNKFQWHQHTQCFLSQTKSRRKLRQSVSKLNYNQVMFKPG